MPKPAIRPPTLRRDVLLHRSTVAHTPRALPGVPPVPAAPRRPRIGKFREQLQLRLQECFPEYGVTTDGASPGDDYFFLNVDDGGPTKLCLEAHFDPERTLAQNVVEVGNRLILEVEDAMCRKHSAMRLDNLKRWRRALQDRFPKVLTRLDAPLSGLTLQHKVPGGEWRRVRLPMDGATFSMAPFYDDIARSIAAVPKRQRREEEEEEE